MAQLRFLNEDQLQRFDAEAFLATKPYPYWNPQGFLTDDGYRILCETMPDVSRMRESFGVPRSHGQTSHDRYSLEYREDLEIAPAWHEFVAELRGLEYRRFLKQAFAARAVWPSFHWHYAPRGASVSPHCDAKRKLGSHIFYLNNEVDWNEEWGGQTLILDDHGRIPRESAPDYNDFDLVAQAKSVGNRSLLFARREKSWHAVRPLSCPEGMLRKVFIVVLEEPVAGATRRVIDLFTGKRSAAY